MSIKFRDFLPQTVSHPKSLLGVQYAEAVYETFDAAVAEASAWIEAQEIEVINLETVILGSINFFDEQKSVAAKSMGGSTVFLQFLRVWYRA